MTCAWTDDHITTLRTLWNGGLSASKIGARLDGISRNAVIGKARRLGLPGRNRHPSQVLPRHKRLDIAQSTLLTIAKARRAAHIKAGHKVRPTAAPSPPPPKQSPEILSGTAAMARMAAETSPNPVALLDLEPHHCRWLLGQASMFCGCKAAAGTPYCADHAARAYQPGSALRPALKVPARTPAGELEPA